ncbi:unnamed protein product [Paramecium octaurelia]|uniref:Uncharacterized protein n=1 Tax=Paramecium octaurelia TaxID=43137 RepID=A0A8S1Y2M5_PAROT|nr:unnamed protein product [Paramecium octaurelia]
MQKFQNLFNLLEDQRKKTSSRHSNSPKSRVTANHDEQFLKASIKAHDSRKYLLNNNPKSIHDRLSSLIRKKSSPINKLRNKHNSLHENSFISNTYTTQDEMPQIILPINEIQMPQYHVNQTFQQEQRVKTDNTNNEIISLENQLQKYPKLQNYFQIKRIQKELIKKEQIKSNASLANTKPPQDNSKYQLKYGIKFDNFISRLQDKDAKIRIQKIYDRYTYQRISTKVYTEIPDVTKYTKLINTQTEIFQDVIENRRLSRSNQKKLESNLKEIYRQVLKN